MKKHLLIAALSLVALVGASPQALAGGRFSVSFSFGFGGGRYHGYGHRAYYGVAPYVYHSPSYYRFGYYDYGYRVPYYVTYRPVRTKRVYVPAYRVQPRSFRQGSHGRVVTVYGSYVPRRYIR